MQLLILPRGTNAEELFSAGAKLGSNGELIFSGFQTTEIPLSTSLLVHNKEDEYAQHTLTSALTLFSGNIAAARSSLPNPKNSIPTSRQVDWVTSYLRREQNPKEQSSLKQEKHVHFEQPERTSSKKDRGKASDSTSDLQSDKKRSKSSHKEKKRHEGEDMKDRKVNKVKG
ncbi:Hypothetical protein GLP15_1938 [Giardia lamblia P15]|uniref:Uncharacterized protein n=1 Tax=Giardia intestinalis (strain P15) TaxID=658858 RepID=E1F639_GIAIA|nr:Hypothetical protein GLP15_1938 [Giardia lamblia P15]